MNSMYIIAIQCSNPSSIVDGLLARLGWDGNAVFTINTDALESDEGIVDAAARSWTSLEE